VSADDEAVRPALHDRSNPTFPLLALAALAVLAVPLFVRMPLTNDAETYDLQAHLLRQGGMLYRDALEPNLPGVIWVHWAVRRTFGDSAEALRIFDLAVFAGILALAARLVTLAGGSARAAAWTAFGLAGFYWSQSEWIHCQRDIWMLAPTLGAITLRLETAHQNWSPSAGRRFLLSFVEGVLWGCGVWLKPYIALPAAAVWLTSAVWSWRGSKVLVELAGLLWGGGVIGAAGVAWMVHTGCWPYFLETAAHWNPEYFAAGRANWTLPRFVATVLRLFPWYGLHLIAAVAVAWLWLKPAPTRPPKSSETSEVFDRSSATVLVAAAYVGWMIQAFAFQHCFDYIHAPAVMLAFLLLAMCTVSSTGRGTRIAWATFAAIALCWSPLLQPSRLELWPACVRGEVTPAIQDRLSHFQNPVQKDLARVADYLQRQGISGQDVCFYNSDFVGMYRRMNLMPPSRYTYFHELIRYLPSHHDDLLRGVAESPHRFVVTDVLSTGIKADRVDRLGPNGPLPDVKAQPKSWSSGYPWSYPVVFRAGTYLVHRIDGPITTLSVPNASPGAVEKSAARSPSLSGGREPADGALQ
jgi:hypothetical protein